MSPPIMVTPPSILLIEDSPGECELFRLALTQTGLDVTLYTEHDADAAFHFLQDRTHHSHYSLRCSPGEVTGVVSTARVERGESPTARSASTETMPVTSPSLARGSVLRAQDQAGGVHSVPSASTETIPVTSPSLILLDLHLRGQDGCDFLKRLRSDARFAALPILIFTTSDDQHDLARCYASGANGYVVKPGTFAELVQCTHDICRYWLDRNRVLHMIGTPC